MKRKDSITHSYDKLATKEHSKLEISNVREEDPEGMCKYHMHNRVHILCEYCSEVICDVCLIDHPPDHKTEDLKMAQNSDLVVNIISNFLMLMKKSNDDQLTNFKDKIHDVDKMVDNFFNDELSRVERTTQELISLLSNLNGKVKKLILMYKMKFKEELQTAKEEYEKYQEEIINLQNKMNFFKNNNVKGAARFKEFKEFKVKKQNIESDFKRLLGFYDLNKSALISEFSMKEFHSYLEKNKIFLNKHFEEYTKLTMNLNVVDKINNVVSFDQSKMLFSSKNYLPKNICMIYQPVDRTNEIVFYDAESEKFKKVQLFPKKINGFSFLPFSRYINFNGRLFVSGGYEENKASKAFWAIEDKAYLNDNVNSSAVGKYNLANINSEFYSNINDKNFVYEDEYLQNLSIIRCSDMVYGRAGHSLVGLSPSLILAFGGTEGNKSCELFHFETNRWEEISSLNETRIDSSAFIYKNFIYVFFGLKFDRATKKFNFLDSIERISLLSMQTSEWENITPKLTGVVNPEIIPRSLCGIAVKGNSSSIYLCGGQVDKDKYSSDVFEYNLELNTLSLSDKKLPKSTAFLEQNFMYLFKTGINFDIYGDVFYCNQSDSFSFSFQKF